MIWKFNKMLNNCYKPIDILVKSKGKISPEDSCAHVIPGWLPVDPHQILDDIVCVGYSILQLQSRKFIQLILNL